MKKEIKSHLNKLNIALNVVGALVLIGLFLVLVFPEARNLLVGQMALAPFAFGNFLAAVFFFLCAWGIKKKNKVAYFATWVSLILIILRLRIIGLVLAVFMGYWLVKSHKLFFKKKK